MKFKIVYLVALFFLTACSSNEFKNQSTSAGESVRFIIKAPNNNYVSINHNDSMLIADEPNASKAEVFEKIDLGKGKCALKAMHGKFVCANLQKNTNLFAESDNMWEWETFELIYCNASKIFIKTSTGKFVNVSPDKGGILIADRDDAREFETFILEQK